MPILTPAAVTSSSCRLDQHSALQGVASLQGELIGPGPRTKFKPTVAPTEAIQPNRLFCA